MRFLWTYLATFFVTLNCKNLIILNDSDPGQCDQTNHATQVLVLDRENKEQILTCTMNDGVYQWTTAGGDDPVGELYSPGYDCSKILDSNPESKDGMYWIHLGGYYPKQVYCDMTTDGGGYILVGRKNSSVTWTLPSNDFPVEPYGDPHWASNLGEAPILDFRVQIATADDLQQTRAHWSFRLQSQRPLKELMVDDKGCDTYKPGIGNIAYVKDLQTEEIISTGFRCSIFGGFQHPLTGFGWHKMNYCLNKPCTSGYAYLKHPSGDIQVDYHGSFSFTVSGNHSGLTHDATAFVGCSPNQICCGCFGPVGGMDDYCSPDCTAINGGTVVKAKTYTWFWVRTSLPKRVWNRCMEYKVKNKNGDNVSYKLLDGSTTPEKGHCGRKEALLNDGIVVVPDGETAKKVPAVPGLLEYRKDTKELYVRANKTWNVVTQEEKVNKIITDHVAGLKQIIENLNDSLNNVLNIVKAQWVDSVILSGENYYRHLLKSWIGGSFTAKLCWRATRDGWAASIFHSRCNYKKPTVTIVKVGHYIFGGYATASWEGSSYKQAPGSFIFSLQNQENHPPFRAPLKDQNDGYAIYAYSSYGPTFGSSNDLRIYDNANSNTGSETDFNSRYQAPSGVSNPYTVFVGANNFSPSEVEVFFLV